MNKHWTDKEIKEQLSKMKLIADTREQVNDHIVSYMESKKIPIITRKLDVGDYSVQIEDMTFEHDFAIERKHNLDEIVGNLTGDRERFEREFLRDKANGTKVYLIIENATWNDVFLGNYRSKLTPKSLVASLMSWQTRYNVTLIFCEKENTAKIMVQLFYYATREVLINGH